MGRKQAIGGRVNVYYNEDGKSVPYGGVVESVDVKRGLRVRLDGYTKREWVTDDDEWEWTELLAGSECPRPVEFIIGAAPFRELLARLLKTADLCRAASKGDVPAANQPKTKRGAAGKVADKPAASDAGAPEPKKRKTAAADKADGKTTGKTASAAKAAAGGAASGTASGSAARKRRAEETAEQSRKRGNSKVLPPTIALPTIALPTIALPTIALPPSPSPPSPSGRGGIRWGRAQK